MVLALSFLLLTSLSMCGYEKQNKLIVGTKKANEAALKYLLGSIVDQLQFPKVLSDLILNYASDNKARLRIKGNLCYKKIKKTCELRCFSKGDLKKFEIKKYFFMGNEGICFKWDRSMLNIFPPREREGQDHFYLQFLTRHIVENLWYQFYLTDKKVLELFPQFFLRWHNWNLKISICNKENKVTISPNIVHPEWKYRAYELLLRFENNDQNVDYNYIGFKKLNRNDFKHAFNLLEQNKTDNWSEEIPNKEVRNIFLNHFSCVKYDNNKNG